MSNKAKNKRPGFAKDLIIVIIIIIVASFFFIIPQLREELKRMDVQQKSNKESGLGMRVAAVLNTTVCSGENGRLLRRSSSTSDLDSFGLESRQPTQRVRADTGTSVVPTGEDS